MPPSPSSPFSRSVTKRTALSIALLPAAPRKRRLHHAQHGIDRLEEPPPHADRYGPRIQSRTCAGGVRNSSGIATSARIARHRPQRHQHQQRHDHRARPVRHLRQMEREPQRQVHDLQRHHRHRAPRHLAEQRELRAGEHVGPLRPARRQDRLSRPRHVRRVRIVADRLQREIRLHAGRQVERPVMEQRPAAVRALDRPQIDADLRLQRRIDAVEEMLQQHVFRRDRRIRLQLEQPVPVRMLPPRQRARRPARSPRAASRPARSRSAAGSHPALRVLRRRAAPRPRFGRT